MFDFRKTENYTVLELHFYSDLQKKEMTMGQLIVYS
nr:MAG TPA: hypothetical protein [Bacteriophage sp.]